jgi:hypothetical protein
VARTALCSSASSRSIPGVLGNALTEWKVRTLIRFCAPAAPIAKTVTPTAAYLSQTRSTKEDTGFAVATAFGDTKGTISQGTPVDTTRIGSSERSAGTHPSICAAVSQESGTSRYYGAACVMVNSYPPTSV